MTEREDRNPHRAAHMALALVGAAALSMAGCAADTSAGADATAESVAPAPAAADEDASRSESLVLVNDSDNLVYVSTQDGPQNVPLAAGASSPPLAPVGDDSSLRVTREGGAIMLALRWTWTPSTLGLRYQGFNGNGDACFSEQLGTAADALPSLSVVPLRLLSNAVKATSGSTTERDVLCDGRALRLTFDSVVLTGDRWQ